MFLLPKIGDAGMIWSRRSLSIWWTGTGSMKFRNGISKFGTSLTLISGRDSRGRRLIGSCTTTQRRQLRESVRDCEWADLPLRKPRGLTLSSGTAPKRRFRWIIVSTHVYANDMAQDVFGTQENIPRDQMVCRAVDKVHGQIKSSSMPNLPLIWSEFNASYKNET